MSFSSRTQRYTVYRGGYEQRTDSLVGLRVARVTRANALLLRYACTESKSQRASERVRKGYEKEGVRIATDIRACRVVEQRGGLREW